MLHDSPNPNIQISLGMNTNLKQEVVQNPYEVICPICSEHIPGLKVSPNWTKFQKTSVGIKSIQLHVVRKHPKHKIAITELSKHNSEYTGHQTMSHKKRKIMTITLDALLHRAFYKARYDCKELHNDIFLIMFYLLGRATENVANSDSFFKASSKDSYVTVEAPDIYDQATPIGRKEAKKIIKQKSTRYINLILKIVSNNFEDDVKKGGIR